MSEAKQILGRIIENLDVAEFSPFFREKNRHNALELSETERKEVTLSAGWSGIGSAKPEAYEDIY